MYGRFMLCGSMVIARVVRVPMRMRAQICNFIGPLPSRVTPVSTQQITITMSMFIFYCEQAAMYGRNH